MKRTLLVAIVMILSACESSTEYGRCVGVFQGEKDERYIYEVSVRNVVIGSLFCTTVFVPALVVATQLQCPVAEREDAR